MVRLQQYRTIWISDLRLGTRGCKAEFLVDFLRYNDADTIYLVGDIIDGWRLKRAWYWPQAHNDVVQKVLRKVRKGTRVIYVPGNHDEWLRDYTLLQFGGVEVADEAVHVTANGRRLLLFLNLDLPGSKLVVGDGHLLPEMRRRYPEVYFVGRQEGEALVRHYASADVFVLPSRTETFGLVLLEALACALPVAALPVNGPLDVIGDTGVGALDWDLRSAAIAALTIPGEICRDHAMRFSWRVSVKQFLSHVVPVRDHPARSSAANDPMISMPSAVVMPGLYSGRRTKYLD